MCTRLLYEHVRHGRRVLRLWEEGALYDRRHTDSDTDVKRSAKEGRRELSLPSFITRKTRPQEGGPNILWSQAMKKQPEIFRRYVDSACIIAFKGLPSFDIERDARTDPQLESRLHMSFLAAAHLADMGHRRTLDHHAGHAQSESSGVTRERKAQEESEEEEEIKGTHEKRRKTRDTHISFTAQEVYLGLLFRSLLTEQEIEDQLRQEEPLHATDTVQTTTKSRRIAGEARDTKTQEGYKRKSGLRREKNCEDVLGDDLLRVFDEYYGATVLDHMIALIDSLLRYDAIERDHLLRPATADSSRTGKKREITADKKVDMYFHVPIMEDMLQKR